MKKALTWIAAVAGTAAGVVLAYKWIERARAGVSSGLEQAERVTEATQRTLAETQEALRKTREAIS